MKVELSKYIPISIQYEFVYRRYIHTANTQIIQFQYSARMLKQ